MQGWWQEAGGERCASSNLGMREQEGLGTVSKAVLKTPIIGIFSAFNCHETDTQELKRGTF